MVAQLQRITLDPDQPLGNPLTLTPGQHHYLCRVLRLKPGDRFWVLDGQGQQGMAILTGTGQTAQIMGGLTAAALPPAPVTLLAALPKGNGFDPVVRQATEIGVQRIVPVISDRTLLHPSPQKVNRWQRIATEAAEQSERLIAPEIQEPLPLITALQAKDPTTVGLICTARDPSLTLAEAPAGVALYPYLQHHDWHRAIAIAIGPEGGWTEAELTAAIASDYVPITLGEAILRAVTAPLVALTLINAAWQAHL